MIALAITPVFGAVGFSLVYLLCGGGLFGAFLLAQSDAQLARQALERGEYKSAEALFAHAVDRAMPVLLNLSNDGQSWRENGISYERVVGRIGPEINAGCPALWKYVEARLEEVRDKGWFGAPVIL